MTRPTILRRPLAFLLWLISGGPRRLQAARLRRQGHHFDAVLLMGGTQAIIGMVHMFPDIKQRDRVYEYVSRLVTAPH